MPPLPVALWAARPDPQCRRLYFAWCERCRRSWLRVGIRHERVALAWGALVAAHTFGEDVARLPLVIEKSGGAAVRVVAGGVVTREWPQPAWFGHLVSSNAYAIRKTHPELSRVAARLEAVARQAWHARNPGRQVRKGLMLAEHVAAEHAAARGG